MELNFWKSSRQWRSSVPFTTAVVTIGVALDSLNYNIVITVFPFRLENLRYHDVSSLVGWLLFVYSAGLVFSTPVIAYISERLGSRRSVMIAGQVSLIISQILLMEAPKFWMMSLGRIFEGISSAIIMTAGLALICDTTPEAEIGGQLGIAMVGLPFGSLLGPPVGGALYDRWGYRAPFIFAILFTLIDLSGRLLVIEGDDKSRMSNRDTEASSESPDSFQNEDQQPRGPIAEKSYAEPSHTTATAIVEEKGTIQEQGDNSKNQPAFQIILRFLSTPRILVGLVVCFFCSFVFSAADVTLPLRLQAVWGLNSRKVGLIYLAAIVPTMISSPLAGHLSDKVGAALVAAALTLCGIPWWGALTCTFSLAFFIVSYAIQNFFVAAVASPITTEFAAVTRGMRGVGYAHTYGTFNVVMGLGNCAGSIIGGQIYAHLHDAWHKLCFVYIGVLAVCLCAILLFTGERPLLRQLWRITVAPHDRSGM